MGTEWLIRILHSARTALTSVLAASVRPAGDSYQPQKWALVAFDPLAVLLWRFFGDAYLRRTRASRFVGVQLVQALMELGFGVDVVGWNSLRGAGRRDYALILGHGPHFAELLRGIQGPCRRVYFSTGSWWRWHNVKEAERLLEVARRTGFLLRPDRPIRLSEDESVAEADAIITLGGKEAQASYAGCGKPCYAVGHAVHWSGDEPGLKDWEDARKHFLFLAGPGPIHKGLDLALEAIDGTGLHLHVCQELTAEFRRVFKRLLERPNVHVYGRVWRASKTRSHLMRRCAWVLSLSCSEGTPSSVVECAGMGLIPIVSRETGIDVGDWGTTVESCTVEGVRRALLDACQTPPEQLLRRSQCAMQNVRTAFCGDTFRRNVREVIKQVLGWV